MKAQEYIMNVARLLLAFSNLSKAEVKQFTSSMNQYLIASPTARRQLIKIWEGMPNPENKQENS
jgi:hypothetical protein